MESSSKFGRGELDSDFCVVWDYYITSLFSLPYFSDPLNELNSKTSIFNASSPTDIDLNDLISHATYTTNGSAPSVRGWKNYPTNSTGYVQIEKFGGIVKQTYTVHSGDMFVRCKITEWSSWKHITMENV